MKVVSCAVLACVVAGLCGPARASATDSWPARQPIRWDGFYLGTHIGVDNSRADWERGSGYFEDPLFSSFGGNGVSGGARYGGQAGYNFQRGAFVFGVEADVSFGPSAGYARCATAYFNCSTKVNTIGSAAARVGAALGNFLVYGKAGGAWAEIDRNLTSGMMPPVYTGSETGFGVVMGVGAEYAFSPAWSGKIEYDYVDLGRKSLTARDQFDNVSNLTISQNLHLIKLGLNYHLGASPGFADVSRVAAGALPQWGWTGLYGGMHVGAAFGGNEWISATGALQFAPSDGSFPGQGSTEGLLAGGQIGVNAQFGGWVAGLELAASASDIDGYAKCAQSVVLPNPVSNVCHNKITSIGTVAGRLGQTWGNLLAYGKAGAAWGKQTSDISRSTAPEAYDESAMRWGWMAGFGLEYALSRNLSAFVEYNHLDFGTRTANYVSQFGDPSSVAFNQRIDLVKVGLNYRLGRGAPMLEAQAADPALFPKASQLPAGWTIEAGARYYGSTGRMQKDLYSPDVLGRLNSRLIYADQTAHAAETFFRFDHISGVFVKGSFGLGNLVSGRLNDEDYPAKTNYSNTLSSMKNGRMMYGNADIGYNILNTRNGKLGGFVGYHSIYNRANGYGCNQIATDDVCIPPEDVSIRYPILSETESWRGLAVGLNAQMPIADRFKLEVDAAYLPYVTREGLDNHWLRSDINPQSEPGHGWGTQLEAILSYAVSERLSVGLGGRYQFFTTSESTTKFPGIPVVSPLKNYSERFGGFLQTSYKFGDVEDPKLAANGHYKAAPPAAAVNWTGIYLGGSIGSGLGRSRYVDPFPAPVAGDVADLGGALAGGQVGVNYQAGRVVFGAEVAANWASIEGTNTCFGNFPNAVIAGFNCGSRIDAVGSLTARAGYAFNRALIYAKGGVAWDRQQDQFNTTAVGGSILTSASTNWGWTAGAGVEYALMSNWSVGLEYKYYDFGKSSAFTTDVLADLAGVNLAPDHIRAQTFTMSVNYRFAPSAIFAR